MRLNAHDRIFSSLQISKDRLLDEMAFLLVKQQISEYAMEVDYFEKKYGVTFPEFDTDFRARKASYEMENDWMSWKFAVESRAYWQDMIGQLNDS